MKKTCIISSGRSGTQLLLKSLCSHPQVMDNKCFEPLGATLNSFERYTPFIKENFGIDYYKISQEYLNKGCPYIPQPHQILEKDNLFKYLDHVFENEDVVKILYHHATEYVLEYLADHPDILIVHLWRRDIVSSFVSLVKLTGFMEQRDGPKWVHAEDVDEYVDGCLTKKLIVDEKFKDRQIELTYEDMVVNWGRVTADLFVNMRVDPYEVPMATPREEPNPIDWYIRDPSVIIEAKARQQHNNEPYIFSHIDLFSHAIPEFERFLKPYAGTKTDFLEIGSFEGKSSVWMLNNILTHPEATLTCVDLWKYDLAALQLVFDFFQYNISKYGDKVRYYRLQSWNGLRRVHKKYDFIYIDGSHVDTDMLSDLELSYALLKEGGTIGMDDYKLVHDEYTQGTKPYILIDKWLEEHEDEIEILHRKYQLWFRKRFQ